MTDEKPIKMMDENERREQERRHKGIELPKFDKKQGHLFTKIVDLTALGLGDGPLEDMIAGTPLSSVWIQTLMPKLLADLQMIYIIEEDVKACDVATLWSKVKNYVGVIDIVSEMIACAQRLESFELEEEAGGVSAMHDMFEAVSTNLMVRTGKSLSDEKKIEIMMKVVSKTKYANVLMSVLAIQDEGNEYDALIKGLQKAEQAAIRMDDARGYKTEKTNSVQQQKGNWGKNLNNNSNSRRNSNTVNNNRNTSSYSGRRNFNSNGNTRAQSDGGRNNRDQYASSEYRGRYNGGQRQLGNRGGPQRNECYCCGKPGHHRSECRFADRTCNKCGDKGHMQWVCNKGNNERKREDEKGDEVNAN